MVDEGYLGRQALAAEHPDLAARVQFEAAACFDLTQAAALKQQIDAFAKQLGKDQAKLTMDLLRGPSAGPQVMNYTQGGYAEYPYADLYDLCQRAKLNDKLSTAARAAAASVCKSMDASWSPPSACPASRVFNPARNGAFIVFPDTESWRRLRRWYTPFTPESGDYYGRWAFLEHGAIADDGKIDNWFELLDAWHDDTSDDPGRSQRLSMVRP